MRILCLHGYGTSAAILEGQLSEFRALADPSFEFVFLNGEVECQKAFGVGNFVKGPFLCYNAGFAPSDIQKSCGLLEAFIEDEGPFDGLLGFSQGGSLALTYLAQHEIDCPSEPPPFKFAILLSTVAAFSPDGKFRNDIIQSLTDEDFAILQSFPSGDLSGLSPLKRSFCETAARTISSARNGGFISATTETGSFGIGKDESIPRVMEPSLLTQRIRIPTVHITGKKDAPNMVELSKLMRRLCNNRVIKVLEHGGAHDVPRRPEDVRAAWSAIEWAILQSQHQSW